MKKILFLIILFAIFPLSGAVYSPEQLINNFYRSRKLHKKIILQSMSESGVTGNFSITGKRAADEFLYDYEIQELKITDNMTAYAHVSVKTRTLKKGIITTDEFWKIIRDDGRWVIDNIYIPRAWQMRSAVRKGSPLEDKVEAIARFEFEYEVESVPPGPPIKKCFAYIQRKNYTKAYYWADAAVKNTYSAQSFFIRGLLNLILGKKVRGRNDLMTAIRMDSRYAVLLRELLSGKQRGSLKNSGPPSSRIMKGKIGRWFAK